MRLKITPVSGGNIWLQPPLFSDRWSHIFRVLSIMPTPYMRDV